MCVCVCVCVCVWEYDIINSLLGIFMQIINLN